MFTEEQLQKIKPNINNFEEERRIARFTYLGMLNEYQLYLQNNNKQLVYSKLNPKQHFLFKRVLHGLKLYKREEIEKMHWDKKRRITKVWKRGQNVINHLKQWVAYKQMQPIFRIFTKSNLGREIYEMLIILYVMLHFLDVLIDQQMYIIKKVEVNIIMM